MTHLKLEDLPMDSYGGFQSFTDDAQGPASWEIYGTKSLTGVLLAELVACVLYFELAVTLKN